MSDKHMVLYQVVRYDYSKPAARTVIAETYGRREANSMRDRYATKYPEFSWKVEKA